VKNVFRTPICYENKEKMGYQLIIAKASSGLICWSWIIPQVGSAK